MQIYLARHGRTNYNELHICNCDPSVDVHLAELGIQQAKSLGQKLQHVHFDQVYVSQLRRTSQTAAYVNTYDAPQLIDARLNDNNSGFDGQHFSVYVNALKQAYPNERTVRFNDGESIQDVDNRAASFMDSIKKNSFENILIITSEAIIQSIFRYCDQHSIAIPGSREIIQGDYITFTLV